MSRRFDQSITCSLVDIVFLIEFMAGDGTVGFLMDYWCG